MQKDFRKFLWFVWTKILYLPQPTRIQYDIAQFLSDGPPKRFIQAFRGVGKSFITAAYIVWRLWKNPDLKIVVVSANETFAQEITTFIKQIINQVEFLSHLRAKPGQRDSTLIFDVGPARPDKSPSVKAVGIFGQLTGSRGDILLFDDVEVPSNSETETMREKLSARTEEAAALRKQNAETIYLGTPQSQDSIYRLLPSKGYSVRVWPSRYPTSENLKHYGEYLSPALLRDIEGDPSLMERTGSPHGGAPTDPERFDEADLMERELEYSSTGFTLQFMLDTRLSDEEKYPLKINDLIVMDVDPDVAPVQVTYGSGKQNAIEELSQFNVGFDGDRFHKPMWVADRFEDYEGSVMVIDPSGRGKDETAYAVTKTLRGMIYARRCGGVGGHGYSEETLNTLAQIAKEEKVNRILIEDNFGDGMWTKLFSPVINKVYPVTLEDYKVSGQKEVRIIEQLEPSLAGHRLVIDKALVKSDYKSVDTNVYRLFYQLSHITKDRGALKHDDRLETLAKAVAYWGERLIADVEDAERKAEEAALEAALEEFIADCEGRKPAPPAWMSRR